MRAATVQDGITVIKDIPKPELNEKGAIVKVSGCGLCGSDMVKLSHGKFKNGDVPGHEVVGYIAEIDTDTDFEVGDKVVLGHHVPCFNCTYCFGDNYSMCRMFKRTNIIPGGFAEYIFVSEEHLQNTVFRVPLRMSDTAISYTEPLGCCLRAIKRAKMNFSANALVIGLGSIGLVMGQAIRETGYYPYGMDINPERVKLAKQLNFEDAYVLGDIEETINDMKLEVNPAGFDAVFMTSGANSAIGPALKAVRDGGTINVFSSVPDDLTAYTNNEIYYRELTILGSYSSSPSDLEDAFELLINNNIQVSELSSSYPLEKLNEAIADTHSGKIIKAYIKI